MPQIHLPTLREIRQGLAAGDAQDAFEHLSDLRRDGPVLPQTLQALAAGNSAVRSHLKQAEQTAAALAGHLPPALPFEYYRQYEENGDREKYENLYFKEYWERSNANALCWMATGQEPYKRDLENTLWALCDAYTWALPAHMWGNSLAVRTDSPFEGRRELYCSRPYENPCMVDLFAAMTAHNIAEMLYLFGEQLEPIVVHRLRQELQRRIFDPVQSFQKSFIWEEIENNWSAVCAGSVGCALLYSVKDSQLLAPMLTRMCQALESYFYGFTEDGICEEGLSYWVYGFRHLVLFAELLRRRTAGTVDLFEQPLIRKIACFPQKGMLNGDIPVTFSDCGERLHFDGGLLHYLHKRVPEATLPTDDCLTDKLTFAFSYSIWTLEQFDPSLLGSTGFLPCSTVYREAEWLVTRCETAGYKVGFAAKGGHNMVSHNHNDAGCFLYELDGEQLICDAGSGRYTRQYFDAALRYSLIACGSQGHSVPLIGDHTQLSGTQYRAENTVILTEDTTDSLSCDIAAAYGMPELRSLQRQLVLHKDTGVLTLHDEIQLSTPTAVTERFTSWRKPTEKDGVWTLYGSNGSGIRIICAQPAVLHAEAFPLHDTVEDRPLYLLDYTLSPAEKHTFDWKIEPIAREE